MGIKKFFKKTNPPIPPKVPPAEAGENPPSKTEENSPPSPPSAVAPTKKKRRVFHLPTFQKDDLSRIFHLPRLQGIKNKSRWDEIIVKYGEKFPIGNVGARVFHPDMRPVIHKIFLVFAVISLSYMSARMVALFSFPPVESSSGKTAVFIPQDAELTEIGSIGEIDLFKARGTFSKVPTVRANTDEVCYEAGRKSSLPIKLLNSIVLMDSVKSLASVQVRNNRDIVALREGDRIPSMAKIDKIEPQKIILKNFGNGECEYIQIGDVSGRKSELKPLTVVGANEGKKIMTAQDYSGGIKNVGNTFNIKKSLRSKALSNIGEILTQARAVQIRNPDGTLSFRMTEIVPGSVYSQLNIQDGDVISSINGKKFRNIGEIMGLFNQVTEIDEFQITLNRNGTTETLEYNFE